MHRAMIISPDLDLCQEMTSQIESVGFETDCVRAYPEAIKRLKHGRYDIVFAEATLPEGKAMDVLPHLGTRAQTTLVILAEDEATVKTLADVCPTNVMPSLRPMNPAQLRSLLREAQQRRPDADDDEEPIDGPGAMLGNCDAMRQVYQMIARVAPTEASVLLIGESGTGKELVAHAIHERGGRSDGPFVAINCGAIPENLIESELFGHVKGSFTGAEKDREGVFERARGGTLFLDEITEMSVEMQVRLLRVLESRRFTRVGGEEELDADVRVIAATNRDPAQAVAEGDLREDLLYRISVFPLHLPPLRERADDVILLANHFLSGLNKRGGTDKRLSKRAERRLAGYNWPGNVRQLRNMVERAYIMEDEAIEMEGLTTLVGRSDGEPDAAPAVVPSVVVEHEPDDQLPLNGSRGNGKAAVRASAEPAEDDEDDSDAVAVPVGTSIDEAERVLILRTLDELDGDKKKAAEMLGISLKTLYNRLKDYQEADEAEPAAGE